MVTQRIIDWLVQDLAALWSLVPPLPSGIATVLSSFLAGETWLHDHLAVWGVVVPWGMFQGYVTIWASLLALWAGVQVIRIVLWLANR
jgi:hypothetical protein